MKQIDVVLRGWTSHPGLHRVGLGLLAALLLGSISTSLAANRVADGQAEWCGRLLPRLPGVSKVACQQSGFQPSGATSRQGFPILTRSIPARPAHVPAKPTVRVLLLGGIHGDELTSSSIVFQWLNDLDRSAASGIGWFVAPVVNPDGLLARNPTRTNANGVDLNRNFPLPEWRQAYDYWVKTGKDPRRFPGDAPLSEPESRWVDQQIERFKPDFIVSIHAPYALVDFDGPSPPLPPARLGELLFRRIGVYPGSLGNYGGVINGIPVVTVELSNARTLPEDKEVKRIFRDLTAWIQRAAQARQPGYQRS